MSRVTSRQNLLHPQIAVPPSPIDQPEFSEWLLQIPGVRTIVDRLGPAECRRRLLHMSPALIPIGLPFIPHSDIWGMELLILLTVIAVAGLYIAMKMGARVKRTRDENWHASVFGYALPILSALLLFPGRAELGLITLTIVALGDGSATLGGLLLGGRRLPWNHKKTLSGLFCFVLVGSLTSTYYYWGEAHPVVPVVTAFLVCLPTALAAAIVESLPIRFNDNLWVGLTALSVGFSMSALLT